MPIFEVGTGGLLPLNATTFEAQGLKERADIQRLLKAHIEALDADLLVLAEEFGDWVDSSRRIDLLCLDTDANLVVVELKRTEDGGHMDLQALRYAAMVSTMTFDQAVSTLARSRNRTAPDLEAARAAILSFLDWTEPDEDSFAKDVRIVLASADFGKELTTTVLWLRERGIDIRCVRLRPYKMENGPLLVDIQPLIPLPEAADFQTRVGAKQAAERRQRATQNDQLYRYWAALLDQAKACNAPLANRAPVSGNWLGGSSGRPGITFYFGTRKEHSRAGFWFEPTMTGLSDLYASLKAKKSAIEEAVGQPLYWGEPPEDRNYYIRVGIPGGYQSPEEDWPNIHTALATAAKRLWDVLQPLLPQAKP